MTCHVMQSRTEYYALGSSSCFLPGTSLLRWKSTRLPTEYCYYLLEIPRDTPSQRAAVFSPVRIQLGLLHVPWLNPTALFGFTKDFHIQASASARVVSRIPLPLVVEHAGS